MGNSLRCCLACVLPCGALDLIRIVHLNGRVEEYGRPVSAGEVLAAHPNHVLSKPCSQGVAVRRILIVAPDSELERGEIYFLIPAASVPQEKKPAAAKSQRQRRQESLSRGDNDGRRLVSKMAAASCDDDGGKTGRRRPSNPNKSDLSSARKKPGGSAAHRRRTSAGSRTAVWKPHLECIVEDT